MQLGQRIIYNQNGDIVAVLGEADGEMLERVDSANLSCIDLQFGEIDYTKYRITKINPYTKRPILKEIIKELTLDQQRIKELENELLLMADAETGGIL